jgi:tetratricopeptide (TPR) repeat protein
MSTRATQADALHQAGRRARAEALFVEAEAMQAERQPEYPRLYSLQGFQYCDLLLADAERAAWRSGLALEAADTGADSATKPILGARASRSGAGRGAEDWLASCRVVSERAAQTLSWFAARYPLLSIGLDRLTLARAALFAAALRGEGPPADPVNAAIDFLRRAGQHDDLPRGLLTRAHFRAVTGDFEGARENLDEAFEIAERGSMKLHLADIHLHRARLFGLVPRRPAAYPWTSPEADLAEARKLIEACGYGRRREELADAEEALKRLRATDKRARK